MRRILTTSIAVAALAAVAPTGLATAKTTTRHASTRAGLTIPPLCLKIPLDALHTTLQIGYCPQARS